MVGPWADIYVANDRLVLDSGEIIARKRVAVSASVGIAFAKDAGSDSEELLRAADKALYAAKRAGRSCFRIFEPGMRGATEAA